LHRLAGGRDGEKKKRNRRRGTGIIAHTAKPISLSLTSGKRLSYRRWYLASKTNERGQDSEERGKNGRKSGWRDIGVQTWTHLIFMLRVTVGGGCLHPSPSHLSCCASHIMISYPARPFLVGRSNAYVKTSKMTKLAQSGLFISHHWHQPRPHKTPMLFEDLSPTRRKSNQDSESLQLFPRVRGPWMPSMSTII
jgi:hypothetical protein